MTEKNIDKCIQCGLCKVTCPVYKIIISETKSPRGKAVLIKKNINDKIYYECSLCMLCQLKCPIKDLKLDEEIRKAREELVNKKIETENNKKMIENIRKFGNPFGEIEEGKGPKELFCC